MSENKTIYAKVHIKSVDFAPRGNASIYRAGSVQVLPLEEALELEQSGIAIMVENPYSEPATSPIPYLEESQEDSKPEIEQEEEIEGITEQEEEIVDDKK